ncbi:nitrogen regulation protein NR(I) [uncultured Oceanicoccus sp.]|uniref:nitrogen regulation protein NR(I) n=1 Tax=uncultured Oceanicoccus sp. TaxID=1706381 RepID=UPI0030DD7F47
MNTNNSVWVVDDDRSIRWVLEKALNQSGIETKTFDNSESLLRKLATENPDAIISDIRMTGMDGLELLEKINRSHPDMPVIITTAHSDLESAVASYQGGAFEYLPKPFDIDDAVAMTERALTHAGEIKAKAEAVITAPPFDEVGSTEIIGEAPAMQEVFRAIGRLSHSNITVLINGESGTGKELVAQALHKHSPRSKERFIALNMAAIPKELMESELFGHEKGAFTGATALREGRFEQANGGTLFLDEIGDMPSDTQTRLLRVLADGEFYRVGGRIPIKVDVRIIAATHQNLETLVKDGRFREDLFHRLNVIRINIPSLRDRREDIPRLIQFFFNKAAEELDSECKVLTKDSEDYLCQLDWAGNVRQLENTCRWITVMAAGREIHLEDLPPELLNQIPSSGETIGNSVNWQDNLQLWADQELSLGKKKILDTAVPIFEKLMIETALKHTHGRKRDAAGLLGWGRNTLTRKMNELRMNGSSEDD